MSLRDQLLKSGLASKQQAKKSAKALKKKKYQQAKAQREDPKLVVEDEITLEIKAKAASRKEEDHKKNLLLEKEKKLDRALQLFYETRRAARDSGKPYYYEKDKLVWSVFVSDKQRDLLAKGGLALASIDNGESIYFITKAAAGEIKVSHPEFIYLHHEPLPGS